MLSALSTMNFVRGANAAVAGTTDVDTSVVDMQAYNSLLIIAVLGDATSGSVLKLRAFGNTANSTSSPTPVQLDADEVSGTAGASDADNKLMILDIPRWNPTYRYAFGRLVIDTQNCVVDAVLIIPYNKKSGPVTQGSTVYDSATLSPLG